MAIVQISRITNRKGLQTDLPQLAGAEFGWSIDERRLYIGNGTLEEGAPVIGNTEILTEFSDILAFQTNYTYKGDAAGYTVQTGPTPSTPISQSLQSWLDQFATVTDFGAVGDGVADDTAAINRALYQLFCREVNPQIRRSLFFPAGVYRITETIMIPPYATLCGDGIDGSIIRLDSGTGSLYVARTADSLQQTGANIGNNGATPPGYITISNMAFENLDTDTSVFLIQDANDCRFQSVAFTGPLTTADLATDVNDTAGIRFASTPTLITNQIVIDGCRFGGTTWAVNTDQQVQGITVTNSKIDTHFQGIVLGIGTVVNGGPTGFRITSNLFDNIYAQGIIFGNVSLNASGHNIFYDVANHFQGTTNPAAVVVDIQQNANLSISDLFERGDGYSNTYARVSLNGVTAIATINGKQLELGDYTIESGLHATLLNNIVSPTPIVSRNRPTISFRYSIQRGSAWRTGIITIANNGIGQPVWVDDYTQTGDTGITLLVASPSPSVSTIQYTSTNTGDDATLNYSFSYLPSFI